MLMGGSTDVDAAFEWLCSLAADGDLLVVRATGTDAYNPYIEGLCPDLNSVATLIIGSRRAANDPFAQQAIAEAEAIFIAGGDQSNYINDWTGTPVQEALNEHVRMNRPIGGTSAGLAVLTQYVYSALGSKGITSEQALADPYNRYNTFARDFVFVPVLQGTIGDTHFAGRDRMGRTLSFLCRMNADHAVAMPRAIAVSEETAVLVGGDGSATVVGLNHAYFIEAPGAPEVCLEDQPLTYLGLNVQRVGAGDTFNLLDWSGTGGLTYQVSASAGVLISTQDGGSVY
jgi:cyanophycinase-like exopeptidase